MAKKGNRVQVILECTEQKQSGVPGMSRYITTKNKKNTPDRLERKKYNPFLKKVTGTGKNFTKCIKMVKSDKTGAYMFKEGIIPNDQVKEFFEEKK